MKTLYILRHAKTVHGGQNLKDFDRYLKPGGVKEAKAMATLMKENNHIPQLIIASPAKRAKQTTEIFCDTFDYPVENVIEDESIYFGGIGDMMNIFQNLDNKIHSAMLIGHNPTVHEMVNYFINAPVHYYPTCAFSRIQFEVNYWIEVKAHRGELIFYETPKH